MEVARARRLFAIAAGILVLSWVAFAPAPAQPPSGAVGAGDWLPGSPAAADSVEKAASLADSLARAGTGQEQGNPFPLIFSGELLPQ
jgi:hypothetical protein